MSSVFGGEGPRVCRVHARTPRLPTRLSLHICALDLASHLIPRFALQHVKISFCGVVLQIVRVLVEKELHLKYFNRTEPYTRGNANRIHGSLLFPCMMQHLLRVEKKSTCKIGVLHSV